MMKENESESMPVGKRIKELRDQRGWAQKKLADRSGLAQAHISKIENGELKTTPTRETLLKLARAFEEPLATIIEGTDCECLLELTGRILICPNTHCPEAEREIIRGPDGEPTGIRFSKPRIVPAVNEEGEENRFCDACGTQLLGKCPNFECGRRIQSANPYCPGCGQPLYELYGKCANCGSDIWDTTWGNYCSPECCLEAEGRLTYELEGVLTRRGARHEPIPKLEESDAHLNPEIDLLEEGERR